jgi:hypothetical protein
MCSAGSAVPSAGHVLLIPRSDAEIACNLGSLVDSVETHGNVAIFLGISVCCQQ